MNTFDYTTVIDTFVKHTSHTKRQHQNFQLNGVYSRDLLALFLVHRDFVDKPSSEGDTVVVSHLADNIIWLTFFFFFFWKLLGYKSNMQALVQIPIYNIIKLLAGLLPVGSFLILHFVVNLVVINPPSIAIS